MISLTNTAADYIKGLLKNNKNAIGFRLSVKQTGCSGYAYVPEIVEQQPPEHIEVATTQGVTVYIDQKYESMLKGIEIDFVSKGLGQSQLIFRNPNAKGECGCGESFTTEKT